MNIKQLATKLNVTSPAIFQHYQKNKKKLGHHVHKRKNQRIFDKVGVKIIEDSFKHKRERNKSITKFNKLILNSYQKRVIDLQNEVNSQNKHLTQLEKLLNQQQQLNLNAQREMKMKYHKRGLFRRLVWRFFH